MSNQEEYELLAAWMRKDGHEITPQVEQLIRAFLALDERMRREVVGLWMESVWGGEA